MSSPRAPVLLLASALAAGCAAIQHPVEVDPAATFAAHQERAVLVVDRFERGRAGHLGPASWIRTPGAPTFVLDVGGDQIAAMWIAGSRVVVHRTTSETSALVGTVTPSWQDGAIRLALEPAGSPAFRTDLFVRNGAGGGPPVLSRVAQTVLDVRGTYEATVRDPGGASKGWLRVRIGPYLPAPRIYEAALPPEIPPEVVAGAVAALNAEIDWIEGHALNVYRSTGENGSLQRSLPVER
jgi:hypothetical protein